jgi:hypothetical protein
MFGPLEKKNGVYYVAERCDRRFRCFRSFPLTTSEHNQLITIMYICFIISGVFVRQKKRNDAYLWGRHKGRSLY